MFKKKTALLRKTGRTTRIADELIQILFETGRILTADHGPSRVDHEKLFEIIKTRLAYEHPWDYKMLVFDKEHLQIFHKDYHFKINQESETAGNTKGTGKKEGDM